MKLTRALNKQPTNKQQQIIINYPSLLKILVFYLKLLLNNRALIKSLAYGLGRS